VKGIEPSYSAWKAAALPLSYTRVGAIHYHAGAAASTSMRRINPLDKARKRPDSFRPHVPEREQVEQLCHVIPAVRAGRNVTADERFGSSAADAGNDRRTTGSGFSKRTSSNSVLRLSSRKHRAR
jgi:hypothetical protein